MMRRRAGVLMLLMAAAALLILLVTPSNSVIVRNHSIEYWLRVHGTTFDRAVRADAEKAISEAGLRAVPALLRAAQKRETGWDRLYSRVWKKLPPGVRRRLRPPVQVRVYTGDAVGSLQSLARALTPEHLHEIARVVVKTNVDQRGYLILGVLRESRAARAELVPYLVHALGDPDPEVRYSAAFVLSESMPAAAPSINALMDCLQDPAPRVREQACWALSAAGTNGTEAVPLLISLVEDPHYSARVAAAHALSRIDVSQKSRCVDALIDALQSQHGDGVEYVVRSLGSIGPAASNAVPLIFPWLDDTQAWRRREAIEALTSILPDPHSIRDKLENLKSDPDADVARAAQRALQNLGESNARPGR